MSIDLVSGFFEYLVSSVEENGDSEGNPLFLIASLKYIINNNLHGTSFNELMYTQHTRCIKELFFRVARNRIEEPESAWRTITNPRTSEIQSLTQRYTVKYGNVSRAISELKPSQAMQLFDTFTEQLMKK